MATPSAVPTSHNTVAISIPRVRFFCAVLFLASSLIYALSRIVSGIEISGLYRTAMFSAILTELLTLRTFLPKFAFTPEVLNAASTSPCLPHLLLAAYLWFNPSTFYFQLLSMMIIYALLAVEYAPTDDLVTQNPYWDSYGKQFSDIVSPRKALLLKVSAHLEILNLVLVLGSIIRFQGNLIQLLVFIQYLTSQYLTSPVMNQAIRFWDTIISRLLNDPRCPGTVKLVDQKVRGYLGQLAGFTRQFIESEPHKN